MNLLAASEPPPVHYKKTVVFIPATGATWQSIARARCSNRHDFYAVTGASTWKMRARTPTAKMNGGRIEDALAACFCQRVHAYGADRPVPTLISKLTDGGWISTRSAGWVGSRLVGVSTWSKES